MRLVDAAEPLGHLLPALSRAEIFNGLGDVTRQQRQAIARQQLAAAD